MTVRDLASQNISGFEVDYDPTIAPASLTPNGVFNVPISVPGGSYTQSFAHSEATAKDVKIQADISDTQSTNQNASVSAELSCSCRPVPANTGTLIVRKDAEGGNDNFAINITPNAGGAATTVNIQTSGPLPTGTGSQSIQLAPGIYTIAELTQPAGWDFKSISCGGGGNTATVNVNQTTTCIVTNTKRVPVSRLQLAKSANPTKYTAPGQNILYTYQVTNNGATTLTNITIDDNKIAGPVSCASTTLAVGESTLCTANYTITAADIAAGSVTNTALAQGKDPKDQTVVSNEAQATVTYDKDDHIDRTKEVIRNFLDRRVDLLASNEPDRARILRRFNRQPTEPTGSIKDGPMKLGGSSEGGYSRFNFATSLSQMRAHAASVAADKSRQADAAASTDASRAWTVPGLAPAMKLGAGPNAPAYAVPTSKFDLWMEGHFQRWDDDAGNADRSGKFGILYVGADYLLTPRLLIGALIQLDWMDDTSRKLNSVVSGNGWMAGPYLSAKLTENILFDIRGAWGTSDNTVNPFGTYSDKFETERWLAKANLTGNWHFGRLRFTPSVGIIFVEETQKAYVDSLGATIPEQTSSIGRMTFGPEFGYAIDAGNGTIVEPHISFTGMWDFDKNARTSVGGMLVSNDDFRVKVEGGVIVRAASGLAFRTTVSYDGLGSDNFGAWGGQAWLSLPLN
jgi:outer membrane autotransporter protein